MWARHLGYMVEEGAIDSRPLQEINVQGWTPQASLSPVVRDISLPQGFRYCSDHPKSVYTKLIADMAERKNLSIADLLAAQVGFTKADPLWEPYAIFPVLDYGRTVYYQGRTYDDIPGQSTKRFPGRREALYGARYWVYGIDDLRRDKTPVAVVVESILNVLSLRRFMRENKLKGVTPVCVFKHYISGWQAQKLLELPFLHEVCLLYDHDATRDAWAKAPKISDRIDVSVAEMPPGPGGKKNDPNDDVVTAWQSFLDRRHVDALAPTSALKSPELFTPHEIEPGITALSDPLDPERLQTLLPPPSGPNARTSSSQHEHQKDIWRSRRPETGG